MTYYFYYTSFCQCRASKLACKGLRTTVFIRRRHFVKMQNDSFKCVSIMRRITEVKNPTEELTGIYRSLKSWDISLTLNMT